MLRKSTGFWLGDCEVRPAENVIRMQGDVYRVPPRAMDILCHLVTHRDRVVPTEELLETFWAGRVVEESSVHRNISELRSALGDSAKRPTYIRTIPKLGYQVVAAVERPEGTTRSIPTIGVSSFVVLSGHEEARLIAEALALEVRSALDWSGDLRVSASGSGHEGKNYTLGGRVREEASGCRVNVFLEHHSDNVRLWSADYDIPAGETGLRRTARTIAYRTGSEVMHNAGRAELSRRYPDAGEEVLTLYHQASNHFRLFSLGEPGHVDPYRRSLERVVAVAPDFAPPFFDLANYYMRRSGQETIAEAIAGARSAIERALELMPDSAHGYLQRAHIELVLELDLDAAEVSFNEALRLKPDLRWAYFGLARIGLRRGDPALCRKHLASAEALGTTHDEALFLLGAGAYLSACDERGDALRLLDQSLAITPRGLQRAVALRIKAMVIALHAGNEPFDIQPLIDEGISHVPRELHYQFAMLYTWAGDATTARALLSDLPAGPLDWGLVALGYLGLGELETGFDFLDRAITERNEHTIDSLQLGQEWHPFRRHPRFERVLATVAS